MTRDEAVKVQYDRGLGKHDGFVSLLNWKVELLNLNYPRSKPQMARVRIYDGNPKEFWVELKMLKG